MEAIKKYVVTILKIIAILAASYVIMVLISHFSVYNSSPDYRFSDSLKAIFLKTEVPAEFFLYFGAFLAIIAIVVLILGRFLRKEKDTN